MMLRCLLPVLLLWSSAVRSQGLPADSTALSKGRLWSVGAATAVSGTGSLLALDQAWYSGYDRAPFHFFNDNGEWMQMDKLGHVWSTYALARCGHAAFRWTGLDERRSVWIGSGVGWLYLAGVEYLDARSAAWGFSWGDMLANTLGSGTFVAQQLTWGEQRIGFKYSAHLTDLAQERPDLLGSTVPERVLKDYNGSTVWLSANLHALGWRSMPTWLDLALGHGAYGMRSATGPGAYRRFFLSPDIALTRIRMDRKWLRSALFVLSHVKVPLPALELDGRGRWKGHWLYF